MRGTFPVASTRIHLKELFISNTTRPATMAVNGRSGTDGFVVPKECKAGVVVNPGPSFEVKVEMVPVPEPGMIRREHLHSSC